MQHSIFWPMALLTSALGILVSLKYWLTLPYVSAVLIPLSAFFVYSVPYKNRSQIDTNSRRDIEEHEPKLMIDLAQSLTLTDGVDQIISLDDFAGEVASNLDNHVGFFVDISDKTRSDVYTGKDLVHHLESMCVHIDGVIRAYIVKAHSSLLGAGRVAQWVTGMAIVLDYIESLIRLLPSFDESTQALKEQLNQSMKQLKGVSCQIL